MSGRVDARAALAFAKDAPNRARAWMHAVSVIGDLDGHWQEVAHSLYADLCDVARRAEAALDEPNGGLLTLDEAAERIGVSRRTVERLVRQKRIRVLRVSPRRTLVEPREVDAYLASLRRAA